MSFQGVVHSIHSVLTQKEVPVHLEGPESDVPSTNSDDGQVTRRGVTKIDLHALPNIHSVAGQRERVGVQVIQVDTRNITPRRSSLQSAGHDVNRALDVASTAIQAIIAPVKAMLDIVVLVVGFTLHNTFEMKALDITCSKPHARLHSAEGPQGKDAQDHT
eukprot:1143050-Pelagomonas_calceolata.AAC.4